MTTWVAINDSQGATWDDTKTLGYLLLESGGQNYLIQEGSATVLNRFLIVSSSPQATWNTIDDSQGATWVAVNNSQGATWSSINDSQGAVWTPISTI